MHPQMAQMNADGEGLKGTDERSRDFGVPGRTTPEGDF